MKTATAETNPPQTESRQYEEAKRAQRNHRFREDVIDAYNRACAVCGSQRKTPDGRPEVEAAHIRSVDEDGPDVIQNGISLCRLHHWAFDNGWISITDEYAIVVRDAPEVEGYNYFAQLDGAPIDLPDSEEQYPQVEYLRFHRQKHGFNRVSPKNS